MMGKDGNMESDKIEEDYCSKCKKIKPKSEINPYYLICYECVNTSTGR